MNNTMTYKGYQARLTFDPADKILVGELDRFPPRSRG